MTKSLEDDTESGNYYAAPAKNRGCFFVLESMSYTLLLVNSAKIAKFVNNTYTLYTQHIFLWII